MKTQVQSPTACQVERRAPHLLLLFAACSLDKLTLAGKSKELCNLVVELDEIISISGRYQNKFRHFMVYFCKKNNIEWLPQMGDSLQVLTASDLLFLVETKLPRHGWDDTKIAALLGNVANKTGLPDMHDKFLDLRQELSRPKPDKGGNVGMIA